MSNRRMAVLLAILLLALVPSLFLIARPFFTPFLLAAILAIVLNPANEWVIRKIGRPGAATLLTTLLTLILLSTILAGAGFALVQELTVSYARLNDRSLEEGGWPALVTSSTDRIVQVLATRLPLNPAAIRTEILDGLKALTGYLLNNVGAALGGITSGVLTGILTAIFLYFLLRYGEDWLRRVIGSLPLKQRVMIRLFLTVRDSVVSNVNGVLVVAVSQGMLLGLGFWFIGVRSPVLWGAIGGLASIIPVVGSPLVWVPVVVAYTFMGLYGKAILLLLWGALVVGSADNVLRSLVVGAREKQHPMVILLATVGGTYAFGVLGILLGPLVISLASALFKEIQALLSQEAQKEGPV